MAFLTLKLNKTKRCLCVCESDQWNSIRQFVKHWPRIDLYCRILNDLFAPPVCADRDLPLFLRPVTLCLWRHGLWQKIKKHVFIAQSIPIYVNLVTSKMQRTSGLWLSRWISGKREAPASMYNYVRNIFSFEKNLNIPKQRSQTFCVRPYTIWLFSREWRLHQNLNVNF